MDKKRTIILDDLEFGWLDSDVEKAIKIYEDHQNPLDAIDEAKRKLRRNGDEVALLFMHLSRQGKIKKIRKEWFK